MVRKHDPSVESKEVVKMVGKQFKQDRGARKEPEDRERPNARRPLMNVRTVLALTLLVAVTTFGAGVALATTGSGFIERTVIARGTLAPQFKIKLRDSSSPGDVVIQNGATNLEFWVAFLDIPVGSPQRIEPEIADPDWVEPAC